MTRRLLLAACIGVAVSGSSAAEPPKVVASFSILGDFVRQVGGARVELETLVGPDGDVHVYEPTPADARSVAEADLLVVNGLGFEGWLGRLVEASDFAGQVLTASEGVEPISANDEELGEDAAEHLANGHTEAGFRQNAIDPHAWQSIANAEIYVRNISEALCAVDADGCDDYRLNTARYLEDLRSLDASIRADFSAIPREKRIVITSHDAFGYFGKAYGVTFLAAQGVGTESEPSAAGIASLIRQAHSQGVTRLFVENISDPRLIEQIAREAKARLGGALFSDALSAADGPASDYLSMMRHNADQLLAAMSGS